MNAESAIGESTTFAVSRRSDNEMKRNSFDWGVHYLRAFAIVCILLNHLWWWMSPRAARAFFVGSTIYFLFISGYLCEYLAIRHPTDPKTYYRRKCTNVVCPYLFWSLLVLLVVHYTGTERVGVISPDILSWRNLPRVFLFGWAQIPYWYIPFVCILFLVSPYLVRLNNRGLILLFFAFVSLAACIPVRPDARIDGDPVSFVLQYTCFGWSYLLGFVYARFKSKIDPYLNGFAIPSLAFGVLLGFRTLHPEWFVLSCISSDALKPFSSIFVLGGWPAQALQKLFFLVPVIVLSNRFSGKRMALLDCLAKCSFTMYFAHYFFVTDFVRLYRMILPEFSSGPILRGVVICGVSLLFVMFNLFLSMILKRLFGRWSRRFVGS